LNLRLGRIDEVGNNGPSAALGEIDNGLEWYQDFVRTAKVSVGSSSRDAVNARVIVIWNDFVEEDNGEEIVHFVVRAHVAEDIL
jgi:hypothetical protein